MKKIAIKIANGKEAFFRNSMEEAVIRYDPESGFWAKFAGELPYKVNGDTAIVTDGLLEGKEITKEEYAAF